jgi:rare lipoprotein A
MRRSYFAGLVVAVLVVLGLALAANEASAPEPVARESEADAIFGLPTLTPSEVIVGKASWYGPGFHGRPTASGVPYNRFALTAAHRTLRAGTVVRVTNLRNDRSAVLVVNDWGPVPADLEIDVSEAAAEVLGFREQGVTRVRIEVYRAANDSR